MEMEMRTPQINAEPTAKSLNAVMQSSIRVNNATMEITLMVMVVLQVADLTVETAVLNPENSAMTVLTTPTPKPVLAEPTASCPSVVTPQLMREKNATMEHRTLLAPTPAALTAPSRSAAMELLTTCTVKSATKLPETPGPPLTVVPPLAHPISLDNLFGSMPLLTPLL